MVLCLTSSRESDYQRTSSEEFNQQTVKDLQLDTMEKQGGKYSRPHGSHSSHNRANAFTVSYIPPYSSITP